MEGLKAVLESLHLRFTYSNEFSSQKTFLEVNLEDVACISKTLFEELSKRLHVPLDSSSENQSLGEETQQPESDAAEEEIVMLLRCCIASINFLADDQSVRVERCEFLHMILCMLCSCQKNDSSKGCKFSSTLDPDTHLRLVRRILEVFMDELITKNVLSKYVRTTEFSSRRREHMCSCLEYGYVLKVVSAHFLQSYTGAQGFRELMENLIWTCKENRATPEISLTTAVSLLINPALASPPPFLHAHLISLISDVIGRVALYDHICSNLKFNSCHMPAFEKSVSLYRRQLAKLVQNLISENGDSVIKSATRGVGCQRPFESYVCPTLNGKLISTIKVIDLDCSSCMMISQTNSNMVVKLKSYVKENLHLLDESCRRIGSLFLSVLLEKTISADESEDVLLKINGSFASEDICLLASILKLMSCSLLQTVLYISSARNSVQCQTSAESYPFKEYELLAHVIDSFGQCRIQLPVQKLLRNKLEAQFSTVNGAKLMLVHFTGLLSVCLANGIEILAKGCLYLMLNVMNLFFYEEGSLNFLSQLVSPGMQSLFHHHPPANMSMCVESYASIQEGLKNRCSARLASKFKEIQRSCIREGGPPSGSEDEEGENVNGQEKACNGVAFLKGLSKNSRGSDGSLEEDLVDFIQCKPGRDYSSWLKNRARYRTQRLEKLKVKAWELKRAAWRSVTSSRKARKKGQGL